MEDAPAQSGRLPFFNTLCPNQKPHPIPAINPRMGPGPFPPPLIKGEKSPFCEMGRRGNGRTFAKGGDWR